MSHKSIDRYVSPITRFGLITVFKCLGGYNIYDIGGKCKYRNDDNDNNDDDNNNDDDDNNNNNDNDNNNNDDDQNDNDNDEC